MLPSLATSLGALLIGSAGTINPIPPGTTATELGSGMGFLEGPVWLGGAVGLVFSDIPASKLMAWHRDTGVVEFSTSEGANGNALDAQGRIVSCQQGGRNLVRRTAKGQGIERVLVSHVAGQRFNSPNDLAIQGSGVIWFTDPPWGLPKQTEGRELPGHWVFRYDPDTRQAVAVYKDFCMPNGIALSPDERTLYVSDTGGHRSHPDPSFRELPPRVIAFALDQDGLLRTDRQGSPVTRWSIPTLSDGMCVDSFGRIYLTGPPGVTVWSRDGAPIGELAVEGSTTNVTLGGDDATTLFITAGQRLFSAAVDAAR